MTEPNALRPATLALFAEWVGQRYASHPAQRFRTPDGGWTSLTYTELRDTVRRRARALLALGIRRGDRVAILAETSPQWTHTHLACLATGAVVVPVYPTAGDEELEWVLKDSGAVLTLCETPAQTARVQTVKPRLPELRHLGTLNDLERPEGPVPPGARGTARATPHGPQTETGSPGARGTARATHHDPQTEAGEGARGTARQAPTGPQAKADEGARGTARATPHGPQAHADLDDLLARQNAVRPEDTALLVYTSGTTGPPKGCRLTHANLGAVQDATLPLTEGGPGDRTYLYLPLAHLLAQLIQFSTLLYGGELCYFGGRVENIVAELSEARPTHLPSVPRLFEKVHQGVLSLAEDLGATTDEELHDLARSALGGNLRWALTGGAPIAPETLDFLRAAGIQVFEGYGMTESGGVITLNHPGAVRYGTVGRPVAGCEVRIAADGEVLARGANVFPGYHANPAGTAAALDAEGWLHTGDLGALDEDGFLTITGRKKDLIITSAGKNLSPLEVEQAIERSRFVSHAVMIGDRRPYPVALIAVDPAEVAGRDAAAVRALVREAVDAANARVSRPARIRAFAVLPDDFTVESGVLTPTLKVRRRAVAEKYAKEIELLYEK
ncbi:long-chain fatty acid--CoA ligase [Streptomyces sp. NPDC059070]|uniref:AMP-dependent synthetase/ligase n=1 Tax=unclassified Streptomyces TaxID=2593676 RepID=UPI0034E294C8